MAKVKSEVKIFFPTGNIYVHWNVDEEDGYGVDITGENGIDGDLVGLGSWSFGLDDDMMRLSHRWFAFVATLIQQEGPKLEEKGEHVVPKLLDYLSPYPTEEKEDLRFIKILVDIDERKERMEDNTLRGIKPTVEIMKVCDEDTLIEVREDIEMRVFELLSFFVMLEGQLDDDEVQIYMHTENCESLGEKEYELLDALGISEDNSIQGISELLSIDIQLEEENIN